jgi:hypothetical protein
LLEQYNCGIPDESDGSADDFEESPDLFCGAGTALNDSLRQIDAAEWKRLAVDVVARPARER